jgi:predicted cobalt transporter CbtA
MLLRACAQACHVWQTHPLQLDAAVYKQAEAAVYQPENHHFQPSQPNKQHMHTVLAYVVTLPTTAGSCIAAAAY